MLLLLQIFQQLTLAGFATSSAEAVWTWQENRSYLLHVTYTPSPTQFWYPKKILTLDNVFWDFWTLLNFALLSINPRFTFMGHPALMTELEHAKMWIWLWNSWKTTRAFSNSIYWPSHPFWPRNKGWRWVGPNSSPVFGPSGFWFDWMIVSAPTLEWRSRGRLWSCTSHFRLHPVDLLDEHHHT